MDTFKETEDYFQFIRPYQNCEDILYELKSENDKEAEEQ